MKWFKHETSCIKDEKIQIVIDRHGLSAYSIYLICLEFCAEKIRPGSLIPEIEININFIKKWTRFYHSKHLRAILQSLHDIGLICLRSSSNLPSISHQSPVNLAPISHQSPINLPSILPQSDSDLFIISCPKLLSRLDNWSRRSVVTTEQVSLDIRRRIRTKNKKKSKNKNNIEKNADLFESFSQNGLKEKVEAYLKNIANKNKSQVISEGRKQTLLLELANSRDRCSDDGLFIYALEGAIKHNACNIGYINAIIRNKKTQVPEK